MKKLILSIALIAGYTASAQVAIDSINSSVNPNDTLYMEVYEGETSVIGTLGGADRDGSDNLTISLSNTTDFVVTPASANITAADGDIGDISPVVAFDSDVKSEYIFNTTITDAGGLSMTAITSVKVKQRDIDNIKVDTITVAENTTNPYSTTMSAWWTKANGTAKKINKTKVTLEILSIDGVAYSVVNGVSTTLPIYLVQNDQMQITGALDHETNEWIVVRVKATRNNGGQSYEEDIYINVTNVNEVPYKIYVK
tara:strand:- start:277 stop:1041 length:765 start_codon:yes stop_codon:yes gene_type:complete